MFAKMAQSLEGYSLSNKVIISLKNTKMMAILKDHFYLCSLAWNVFFFQ